MIGKVITTRDIPAGAVIYYDAAKNALVVFDDKTEQVHIVAMPFLVTPGDRDKRVKLP
jgi:hypothetical protein